MNLTDPILFHSSYMAVTGLPQPRNDHAVVMARFAKDILKRMRPICKRLTIRLGPDTCELNIRIGMHSGPVTGGLLRGERSRFQLFGDTVNTASRIESTGQGGMIHVSHATAELLTKAGKGNWVSMRPTKIVAKGLGALQTYWLNAGSSGESEALSSNYSSGGESDASGDEDPSNRGRAMARLVPSKTPRTRNAGEVSSSLPKAKLERLVAWNVDLLHRLLKQIVARRQCLVQTEPTRKADADEGIYKIRTGTLLDEVKESIELPSFNYSRVAAEEAEHLELEPEVYQQLEEYVRSVANMYSKTAPFHGFEHASHGMFGHMSTAWLPLLCILLTHGFLSLQ
jgi:Adenylate and Guanylate cyclase catalytic domain